MRKTLKEFFREKKMCCAVFWKNEVFVYFSNYIKMFLYLLFADILTSERNKAAVYAISDCLSIEREKRKQSMLAHEVFP